MSYPTSPGPASVRHAGLSRRDLLRAGMSVGALAALGGVNLAAARSAHAVELPAISSCDAWGAVAATDTIAINATAPVKILIHHTETPNSEDYSQEHAFALSRSIQEYHIGTNGWIDTGQHFTVSRGGYITEGRHRTLETLATGSTFVLGAHCTGQNETSLGIENEGTYMSSTPPVAQWDNLVALCAYLCQTYAIAATELYGHRDFLATDCPGDLFYAQLPDLRSAVAAQLG